jgi:hypothetical protein
MVRCPPYTSIQYTCSGRHGNDVLRNFMNINDMATPRSLCVAVQWSTQPSQKTGVADCSCVAVARWNYRQQRGKQHRFRLLVKVVERELA